jgi:Gluconate 2-dehydrogenase subunit 3
MMDRRETIKWMLAASAVIPLSRIYAAEQPRPYGTDPDLQRVYHSGELWPLTLTQPQRDRATLLCDTLMPADAVSPSASQVGVVDLIDEWISAPYPIQRKDRDLVLQGLDWLESESLRRFSKPVFEIATQQMYTICDDICWVPKAKPEFQEAARFFARYRDLTTGGFYTSPQGRADLRYVGNTPLPRFDGPPLEVLKKVGLA